MPKKKNNNVSLDDLRSAKKYLQSRAFEMKKGYPPVVYQEELEMVLEVLETGAFREWLAAMEGILPEF